MNIDNQNEKDLKTAIVDRIAKENIAPRSKAYWFLLDVSVWGLWALAVLCGSLAVAVLLFASLQMSFELHEVTHNSVSEFIFEWLPLIWIAVLLLMSGLAYFNMRHTKRGYKYSLSIIVLSSISASIIGGFIFHYVGVGYYVDTYLGRSMPMYHSQETFVMKKWQQPESGRLVGRFVENVEPTSLLNFEDINGQVWRINVQELKPMDMQLARSGEKVRVIGVIATGTTNMIHSCAIFPWLFDKPPALKELREQRQMFLDKLENEFSSFITPQSDRRNEKSAERSKDDQSICESWLQALPVYHVNR